MTVSELKQTYPQYCISKNRIDLTADMNVDEVLERVQQAFANEKVDTRDGVKIDFADGWVHLRRSNTEPIIRVYSEADTMQHADALAHRVMNMVKPE